MRKRIKGYFTILLVLAMIIPLTTFAVMDNDVLSNENEVILFFTNEELGIDEIDRRIELGITDVDEEDIVIDINEIISGDADDFQTTYLGSTTRLLKESIINGEEYYEYETTVAVGVDIDPDDEDNGSLITPFGQPVHGYSATVYLTISYSTSTIKGVDCGRITGIQTYYIRHDAVLPVPRVTVYESSVGKMWNGSTNMGVLSLNRQIGYKTNPATNTVYAVKDLTSYNSLTGYYVEWMEFVGAHYIGAKAVYTITNHAGNNVTYTIFAHVYANGNVHEGLA